MKPTTKDLAREAGVSLASVDRVLNGRSGVNESTIKAVQAAATRIGFVRNISASNLARQRIYRFLFLLPQRGGEFLQTITERIEEAKSSFMDSSVFIEQSCILSDDPHHTVGLLAKIVPEKFNGVAIMAGESPQLRDAIMRLEQRGVHVVRFISGDPDNKAFSFAGIDNYAAGATAARLLGRFCGNISGKILVITENLHSLDVIERRLGFDHIMTQDYPNLSPLPSLETYGTGHRTDQVIANAYANHPDIVGAYILNSEARLPLATPCGRRRPCSCWQPAGY